MMSTPTREANGCAVATIAESPITPTFKRILSDEVPPGGVEQPMIKVLIRNKGNRSFIENNIRLIREMDSIDMNEKLQFKIVK